MILNNPSDECFKYLAQQNPLTNHLIIAEFVENRKNIDQFRKKTTKYRFLFLKFIDPLEVA